MSANHRPRWPHCWGNKQNQTGCVLVIIISDKSDTIGVFQFAYFCLKYLMSWVMKSTEFRWHRGISVRAKPLPRFVWWMVSSVLSWQCYHRKSGSKRRGSKLGTITSGNCNKAECNSGKHLGVQCTKQYERAAQKSWSLLQSYSLCCSLSSTENKSITFKYTSISYERPGWLTRPFSSTRCGTPLHIDS